jgi:hypothetical protein
MIRINLLDTQRKKRTKVKMPTGAPIILLGTLLLLGEGLGLFYWMTSKEQVLAAQRGLTREEVQRAGTFSALQKEVKELQEAVATSEEQAAIFKRLNPTSTGTAHMLLYLNYILTVPPTGSQELAVHQEIGWNTEWDPRRGWFMEVREYEDGSVLLVGNAIDFSDADEMYKRISDSVYFLSTRFVGADRKKVGKGKAGLVEFRIEATLNYNTDVATEGQQVLTAASVGGVTPKGKKRHGR